MPKHTAQEARRKLARRNRQGSKTRTRKDVGRSPVQRKKQRQSSKTRTRKDVGRSPVQRQARRSQSGRKNFQR